MLDNANAKISKKYDLKEDGILAEYQHTINNLRIRIVTTNKFLNEASSKFSSIDT